MQWNSRLEWEALKEGGPACPLCIDSDAGENAFSFKVVKLSQSIVRLPKNQYMLGWTILVCKRHVNELFELTEIERTGFWNDVSRAAQALQRIYDPAKINYCIWGNHVPHLHCHLFPRQFTDDPAKPLDQNEHEMLLDQEEYRRMITRLRQTLDY